MGSNIEVFKAGRSVLCLGLKQKIKSVKLEKNETKIEQINLKKLFFFCSYFLRPEKKADYGRSLFAQKCWNLGFHTKTRLLKVFLSIFIDILS